MKKSSLLITVALVAGSVHPLFSMEKPALSARKRTFSFCPGTEAFRTAIAQDDPEKAQLMLVMLPDNLTLQYNAYIIASAPVKPILLAAIKAEQRRRLLRDLPIHHGISDFIKNFSELRYNARERENLTLDAHFLVMIAELRQELLYIPIIQQKQGLKELVEQMPAISQKIS